MAQNDFNQYPPDHPGRCERGWPASPPGLSTGAKIWWWFHFLILVNLARCASSPCWRSSD